jgi:thymidylate synthase (FAD)
MQVKLLSYTQNPKEVIYASARQCYSKLSAGQIFDERNNIDSQKVKDFITHLKKRGHLSPLEHVNFTFAIEGISRACTHQLVRHRLASYSQQSQRYVSMDDFKFIIPPEIQKDKEAESRFLSIIEDLKKSYHDLRQILEKNTKLNKEQINQDLRFILPNAAETKIVVTMNVRELLHFFAERLCLRAQWEIRALAAKMLVLCSEVLPEVFSETGAKCRQAGFCPEDNKECALYPGK